MIFNPLWGRGANSAPPPLRLSAAPSRPSADFQPASPGAASRLPPPAPPIPAENILPPPGVLPPPAPHAAPRPRHKNRAAPKHPRHSPAPPPPAPPRPMAGSPAPPARQYTADAT